MPAAITYDPTNRDYRQAAAAELAERRAWMARAWQYYRGDHPKPLRARAGRPDNNVIINLVAQHADHTISFAVPVFPALELDRDSETAAEAKLNDFWRSVGGEQWLINAMLPGLLGGHVFVRIVPPERDGQLPRAVTLDPGNTLVAWAADDYEKLLWYEVYYRAPGAERRQDIIAPGVLKGRELDLGGVRATAGDTWVIMEYERLLGRGETPPGEEAWVPVRTAIWPHQSPPIVDWKHLPAPGRYYGQHELGGLALNDAVNKVASDIKSILRVHAAPRRVAIGVSPDQIKETAIDSFWAIDNRTPAEVDIKNLEMQSDLQSSMAFLDFLTGAYMQQARVTILSGGPDAYKGITNLGIKAAFMSQLGKTQTLQQTYGAGIARISAAALEMMGMGPAEPEVEWKHALPVSEIELTNAQVMQINAGIQSRRGAAGELGHDYERVQAQLMQEALTIDAITPGAAPVTLEGRGGI